MPYALDRARSEYQTLTDRYRALEQLAQDEDRDPNEAEQTEMAAVSERLRALQPRINELVEVERSLGASAETLATVPAGFPTPQRNGNRQPARMPAEAYRSWGEYAVARALGTVDPEAEASIDDVIGQLSVRRAIIDVTTADVAGILPPAWLRDIVDLVGAARPFVEAFSRAPLPDTGMTLTYPRVAIKPLVGKQTAEKTDVASRKSSITAATAPVETFGGGEDVSVQVLQRTDPSYLQLMLELYAEQMALATDLEAITIALGAITQAAITLSAAAPAAWNNLLATGIGQMFKNSKLLPDVFVAGADLWSAFAGAADSTGRPLFPNVNGFNPVGRLSFTTTEGEVRGLTFAVDPNMTPTQGVIGNARAFTSFLGPVQTMSVNNPTKLGVDYATYQMVAFAARRPDAMAKVVLGA